MDIVTLGAALNGSAEYVNSHFKGGSNIQIVDNPDGTQTINASGEVSAEDTVARADIAAIKDGETLDSFGDVESALGNKADSSTTYTKTEVDTALGGKVDKETGKGLSTNDYTDTEKAKLAGIEAQANKTTVDDSLSGSSTNPVQNKVVKTALDGKANASTTYTKTEVDTALSGKQATLTTAQLAAANSGITSADVAQITTNKNNILLKANTSDVNTATASLQNQINQIAQAAGTGSADTEVAQARVGTDGTSYNTLKARLDAENTAVKTYISSVKDITKQAFENSIVMRQPELTFDYKHIDINGMLKNNENKNLTSNMVLAVKNSNISVDAGYKYQYALYNKTTGTFIRRQTWLTSDTLTVLNDDYRIRVEISDIQESVLSDMSILTHLHTKIYSSTLPVTEYVAETEADAVRQSNNIVNTLGINTFRQKTMEVADPTTYKSWPFVGVAGGKLLCLYSVGTSHTDTHSSIYMKYSDNGVIWSSDREIISTDSQRDNVTGKGYDEDGNLIFWVRRGNPGNSDTMFELWKATDYKTFEQVSTPTFSSVHGHIGDIVSVPNVGLFAFWNSYGDSRSWGYVKSTDNGETWTETTIETGQAKTSCPVEMSAVYLGNGKILVMGRQDWDGSYGMFQIQSDDYGETFTKYSTNIDYTGSTPSVLYDSESDTISMYCYLRYAGELRLFTTLSETVWNNPTSWTSGTVIATAATGENAGNVNACQFGDIQIASFFSGNSTNTGIYATIV